MKPYQAPKARLDLIGTPGGVLSVTDRLWAEARELCEFLAAALGVSLEVVAGLEA